MLAGLSIVVLVPPVGAGDEILSQARLSCSVVPNWVWWSTCLPAPLMVLEWGKPVLDDYTILAALRRDMPQARNSKAEGDTQEHHNGSSDDNYESKLANPDMITPRHKVRDNNTPGLQDDMIQVNTDTQQRPRLQRLWQEESPPYQSSSLFIVVRIWDAGSNLGGICRYRTLSLFYAQGSPDIFWRRSFL